MQSPVEGKPEFIDPFADDRPALPQPRAVRGTPGKAKRRAKRKAVKQARKRNRGK